MFWHYLTPACGAVISTFRPGVMQSQTYAQAGPWMQTSLASGNVCMILFRFTLKPCSCFHLAWTANQASQGTEIWIKHEEEVVQRGRWADADTCRRIFSNQSLMIVDIMELWGEFPDFPDIFHYLMKGFERIRWIYDDLRTSTVIQVYATNVTTLDRVCVSSLSRSGSRQRLSHPMTKRSSWPGMFRHTHTHTHKSLALCESNVRATSIVQ